jgi:hypothetical protein
LRRLQLRLCHLDKLLLLAADPATIAYVLILVDVAAADKPKQLADVVGRDADVKRHPGNRFEHLVVACPPRAKLYGPEDILDVYVGLGEILVPESLITKSQARAKPKPSISRSSSNGKAALARSSLSKKSTHS